MKYQTSFKKNRSLCSLLIVGFWCLIFVASLLISQGSAYAAQVTLAWDASDGAAGYKIYYGTTSNNYTSVVDVGTNLTYTFTDLPDGNTYYFAATAYDASHLESDYSAEISYNAYRSRQRFSGETLLPVQMQSGIWTEYNDHRLGMHSPPSAIKLENCG